MYSGDKTRRKWEKLRVSYPKDISEIISTFEPFSFIPDLRMLVQVFPYDRRLPTLPLLIAEPLPELELTASRPVWTGQLAHRSVECRAG